MFRCAPPPGVDWYDIDFPEVVDLRAECLPGPSHLVGADLTSTDWITAVPGDRPAMIVAEGFGRGGRGTVVGARASRHRRRTRARRQLVRMTSRWVALVMAT